MNTITGSFKAKLTNYMFLFLSEHRFVAVGVLNQVVLSDKDFMYLLMIRCISAYLKQQEIRVQKGNEISNDSKIHVTLCMTLPLLQLLHLSFFFLLQLSNEAL